MLIALHRHLKEYEDFYVPTFVTAALVAIFLIGIALLLMASHNSTQRNAYESSYVTCIANQESDCKKYLPPYKCYMKNLAEHISERRATIISAFVKKNMSGTEADERYSRMVRKYNETEPSVCR